MKKGDDNKIEDITGITCIYIPVKDVYESIKWYQKSLGCEPTNHNPIKPGMESSILRFPDNKGDFSSPSLRQMVPAIFLVTEKREVETLLFKDEGSNQHPIACFITPHIHVMYKRFKEYEVNILTEIQESPFGSNFKFYDPDGNMLEIWQP
ncbi:VOC family protein [Metabacillus niabensis]|uniref:VOC family protein n=1 Tax=Metabacillus niabensis TaxID=324854 RepID=UPI001CFA006A|nr:VOC family protein [Metabacillus niabensis]